jgi:hypothetical protein
MNLRSMVHQAYRSVDWPRYRQYCTFIQCLRQRGIAPRRQYDLLQLVLEEPGAGIPGRLDSRAERPECVDT